MKKEQLKTKLSELTKEKEILENEIKINQKYMRDYFKSEKSIKKSTIEYALVEFVGVFGIGCFFDFVVELFSDKFGWLLPLFFASSCVYSGFRYKSMVKDCLDDVIKENVRILLENDNRKERCKELEKEILEVKEEILNFEDTKDLTLKEKLQNFKHQLLNIKNNKEHVNNIPKLETS